MLVLSASILFLCHVSVVMAQSSNENATKELEFAVKLLDNQKHSEATTVLRKIVTEDERNAKAWFYLGVANVHLGNKSEARTAFERAIQADPNFAQAHSNLGQLFASQGRLELAKESLGQALALKSDDPFFNYSYALLFFRMGLKEDSLRYLDIATTQKPDYAEAYLLKAQVILTLHSKPLFGKLEDLKTSQLDSYRTAIAPLNQYLLFAADPEESQVWREVLETLTNFSDSDRKAIRSGNSVTTKMRLISKPEPQYTEQARKAYVAGRVVLKVVLDVDGVVKHIHVLQALPGLTEQAIKSAKHIQFAPATFEGVPVPIWLQLEYNFNLY